MRILIVEDEPILAATLRDIVRDVLGPRIESITIRHSLEASRCHIWEEAIDLLFLDLNLLGESGFDLLKEAVAGSFQTIIVSAHFDRALEAFAYGVLDFIPKPVETRRLRQAIERFTGTREMHRDSLRYLSAARDGTVRLIELENIFRLEADGKKTKIHCVDGSGESVSRSLGRLERMLPPDFFRIHKSHIVVLAQIEAVERNSGSRYFVIMKNGDRLPVGRGRYAALMQSLS